MKEHGVIRRRVSGPEAAPYMNIARNLLGMVKQQIQFGGLSQLSRTVNLPNGVRITVMSIFGQDEVRISVPTFAPVSHSKRSKRIIKEAEEIIVGENDSQAFRWTKTEGMESLGSLGINVGSSAYAISADGLTIVGQSNDQAFRWTKDKGMESLGIAAYSVANAVSGDGSTIVGVSGNSAFIWTEKNGAMDLGFLPTGVSFSNAQGISADGTVVVGYGDITVDYFGEPKQCTRAFVWTKEKGMVEAAIPPGFPDDQGSVAYGVSADGRIITGAVDTLWFAHGTSYQAIREYIGSGSVETLGVLRDDIFSGGIAISGDGSTVVGISQQYILNSFRWNQATGMEYIGNGFAYGVSNDGSIVVGTDISYPGSQLAFRWEKNTGMVNLEGAVNLSAAYGIATPEKYIYYVDDVEVDKKTYDATPD